MAAPFESTTGRPSGARRPAGPRALSLLLLGLLLGPPAHAQPPSAAVTPAMARGAADAPVTVVEFSDYQ